MRRPFCCLALALAMCGGTALVGQPPATPKDAKTKDEKPEGKAKGQLPQNWKPLGLTEKQTQDVYKIQNKYNTEIDKLEAQIKEMKDKMTKERLDVLTADQKKRLEEIMKGKAGTEK